MFLDLLTKRRSIRQFEEKPVEKEKIDILIEAMLRSPSSRGLNSWEFIVVTDPEIIRSLATSKPHGAAFVKNATLAIVVLADPSVSDVWVEDCSIAAHNIHLATTDLGLGSCWVQIRLRARDARQSAEEYVKNVLDIKKDKAVEAIIAIGYPKEQKAGHSKSSLQYDKVSYERYGNKE